MHLYELSEKYQGLLAWLNSDEPIVEDLKLQLENIKEQLKDKAENIGKMVLEYESDVTVIDNELTRLSTRKKVLTNKVEWLKTYLLQEMQTAKIEKINGNILTIALRKNPVSCKIIDELKIPAEFWRTIPETKEINKSAILTYFKDSQGAIPDGVEIITDKKHLEIK